MDKQIFQRLSISQRFFLSVGLFSLPLAVLFYFNIDQLSGNMSFAAAEIDGDQYQRSFIKLLKGLGDYQIAVNNPAVQDSERAAAKDSVDKSFEEAESLRQIEPVISFTQPQLKAAGLENLQFTHIKEEWQALGNSSGKAAAEVAQQASTLDADIRAVISHAGDTSNLTLDPEMDSYYLADFTSVAAAQTLDRINALTLYIEPLLNSRALTVEERTQIAIYAASFKESDVDRITNDVDTALTENLKAKRGASPSLKPSLDKVYGGYKNDTQALLAMLGTLSKGGSVSRDDFQQTANAASQASFELWQSAVGELDVLLKMRIDGYSHYRTKLISGTLTALAIAFVVFYLSIRGITRPLGVVIGELEQISQGVLSTELPEAHLARGDEVGVLARATQKMCSNLRMMFKEVATEIDLVATSSSELLASSSRMTANSLHASEKAHSVAAAAEEMSSNSASVARGMNETTANLEHITSATGQMTSAINEVGHSSETARRITDEASRQALQITRQISHLEEAAREIGKVTETITEISSQTNLLALNATIEAARAGAAGKGFAVVASEIKALAQQTAAATEDIKNRITGVQSATASGISEIAKVSSVIEEVRAIVATIAAAIEQQSATTGEIARNISAASSEIGGANLRVSETSQVSHAIAKDIAEVNAAAGQMAAGSDQVKRSAAELSAVAEQLRTTVARFKA